MATIKRAILPFTILVVGSLSIAAIVASKPKPMPNEDLLAEPPKTKINVQAAKRETVVLSAKSQGTVTAKREIDIVSQVSGVIMKVERQFVNGDFFNEGEVLIEIDDRDYRSTLLSAKSRLAQAKRLFAEEKGRSRQAKKEWSDLGNKEANDLFLRKPQLAEALSAVESAQADVEIAKLNIERTKIRVPFSGRIKETYVNLGQFVSRGTALAKVFDSAVAEIRLPLSDRQLVLLDLPLAGQKIERQPNTTLTAFIAGEKQQWQGVITRTEASVDVNSRMYYAIAEVAMPYDTTKHKAPLLPGLFVSAEIEGKHLDDVIVLPREAIIKRNNIYSLDENNSIEMLSVQVLRKQPDTVWIKSDITEDTAILIEKHALVTPGTVIEPVIPDAKTAQLLNIKPNGE